VHLLRQVAAALLACLALALALRPASSAADAPPDLTTIVVAAGDLPVGAALTEGDLAAVAVPAQLAPAGTAADPADLVGQVLAAPVRAGEAVTDVRVVGPALWSQVPDGLVAAPVRLADLAMATLLHAGDRVDVLATTATGGPAADATTPDVEVVAEAALVLAVPAGDDTGEVGVGDGGLLVLAVRPEVARGLAAAGARATLTVTLGPP
jgi:Flp pilus assembly protein CpaB